MSTDVQEIAAGIIVASILLSMFLEAVFQIDQNAAVRLLGISGGMAQFIVNLGIVTACAIFFSVVVGIGALLLELHSWYSNH